MLHSIQIKLFGLKTKQAIFHDKSISENLQVLMWLCADALPKQTTSVMGYKTQECGRKAAHPPKFIKLSYQFTILGFAQLWLCTRLQCRVCLTLSGLREMWLLNISGHKSHIQKLQTEDLSSFVKIDSLTESGKQRSSHQTHWQAGWKTS